MAFDRYLAAAPTGAIGVPDDVREAAGRSAANYQKDFVSEQKVVESPKVDATIVQGKAVEQWKLLPLGKQPPSPPKFKRGDFQFAYRDDKVIPSFVNPAEALGSTVEFQDIGEGRTISVVSSNTALLNVDAAANTGIDSGALAALSNKQRQAVLLKMAIDGQFGRNIKVDDDTAKEAANMWVTPTNAHRLHDIEKAWALVKQNTSMNPESVSSTFESDQFTMNIRDKFGITPSEYMINGYSGTVDGVPAGGLPGAEEDMEAERVKMQVTVDELTKSFYEKGKEKNPWVDKIAAKSSEFDKASALLAQMSPDTQAAKAQKRVVDDANTQMQHLHVASQAWDSERRNSERMLEIGRKGLSDLMERISGGQSNTQLKAGIEIGGTLGKYERRWSGLEDKSLVRQFGYRPAAYSKISPTERWQYIVDKKVTRKEGESAVDFAKRRHIVDRADTPELMWYLAKRDPKAFATLSESLPTEEDDVKSALTSETMVNQSFHFNKLFDLNEKLRKSSNFGAAFDKVFDPEMKAAASSRANLIGQMRVFIVGPGNPSNFEQEILHAIVPEIEAIFTVGSFNKERLRALAMISILAHHNEKVKLGYEATDTTIGMYNQRFGKLLGKPLTIEELDQFREFSEREANAYDQMKKYGNIDVGDRQGGGYSEGKKSTKVFGNEYFDRVQKKFGK